MIDRTGVISTKYDTELSSLIRLCAVYDKIRQDNDIIDHTILLYIVKEAELSCLIRQGTVYDEDQTG